MIDAAASCCPIISPAAPGLDKFISIAHPDFREELIQSAGEMHIRRRSNKR